MLRPPPRLNLAVVNLSPCNAARTLVLLILPVVLLTSGLSKATMFPAASLVTASL